MRTPPRGDHRHSAPAARQPPALTPAERRFSGFALTHHTVATHRGQQHGADAGVKLSISLLLPSAPTSRLPPHSARARDCRRTPRTPQHASAHPPRPSPALRPRARHRRQATAHRTRRPPARTPPPRPRAPPHRLHPSTPPTRRGAAPRAPPPALIRKRQRARARTVRLAVSARAPPARRRPSAAPTRAPTRACAHAHPARARAPSHAHQHPFQRLSARADHVGALALALYDPRAAACTVRDALPARPRSSRAHAPRRLAHPRAASSAPPQTLPSAAPPSARPRAPS